MTGKVSWWDPRRSWGRIRSIATPEKTAQTFFFKQEWIASDAQTHRFVRGETVDFDGDRDAEHRLVAYRVRPLKTPVIGIKRRTAR